MKIWRVYTLSDPRTGEVRYVGMTSKPVLERLCNHIGDTVQWRDSNKPKISWIHELLGLGLAPLVREEEQLDEKVEALRVERLWTKMHQYCGSALLHGRKGKKLRADDCRKNRIISPEHKEALSRFRKTKVVGVVTREFLREAVLAHPELYKEGRRKSGEKTAAARTGKTYEEIYGAERALEVRRKQSESGKKRKS